MLLLTCSVSFIIFAALRWMYSGVIDIRELLLPFFVTRDGRTVGQIVTEDFQKAIEAPKQAFLS